MFTFSIAQWQGWAPQLKDTHAWQQWAHEPRFGAAHAPQAAALDFLPPMQRRRLSPLARGMFACAWPVAHTHANMPLVFASRHGETLRSVQLLQTLATDAALSPTAFCLSVHNAIAAQWSIIRGETAESVALAAEDDGLEHAMMEAVLLLANGHPEVLVVVAEEVPPACYTPWIADVPTSYVAAFRVCPGEDWCVSLLGAAQDPVSPAAQDLPNPLSLVRHLLLGTMHWQHTNDTRCWQWTRQTPYQPQTGQS